MCVTVYCRAVAALSLRRHRVSLLSVASDAAALGRIVRSQRERLHLSQAALAEQVGVSRSAISELEAGRISQPRATVFARLAKALGLPAAALLAAVEREANAEPDEHRAGNALEPGAHTAAREHDG